jgi:nucleotide-binding universal stress UspA family protein
VAEMQLDSAARPMHIVISVDTSAHTLAGAHFVHDLLPPSGSRVTVLGTLDPGRSRMQPEMLRSMNKVTSILESKNIEIKTDLLRGHRIDQLLQFTQQHPADLLIIGANGLRTHFGIFMNGAPQQLVETAHCPVLVARASYTHLQHVLLAVDFTWSSRRAIRYLAQFHLPASTKVTVMHVKPPETDADIDPYMASVDPQLLGKKDSLPILRNLFEARLHPQEKWLQTSQGVLRYAIEVLRAAGIKANSVVTHGDAATTITNYARRHHVDLVIAGSRTISQVASWITGDITRKLIHNAGCAVLIVKESMGDGEHSHASYKTESLRSVL